MDQAEPAKPAFELRLKPVLDLGKTHIRHEGASLVKEGEVSRRRAIDN